MTLIWPRFEAKNLSEAISVEAFQDNAENDITLYPAELPNQTNETPIATENSNVIETLGDSNSFYRKLYKSGIKFPG